jgi:hypothetical protein
MSYGSSSGLFPVLNYGSGVVGPAGVNLAEIFHDHSIPSVVESNVAAIDSSIIFMLFLSKSLRKHLDGIVALPPSPRSIATTPTVATWFTNYDKLLKRLSIPHFTQLITEAVYEGAQVSTPNFSIQPLKAELQARLEVAQCGMRCMEQLPAWTGVNPAAASSSAPVSAPVLLGPRSLSTEFDASSASSLSVDAKGRYFDQLVSAHTFVCILCGIFDLSCVHQTVYWPSFVSSLGESAHLHAWLLRLLQSISSSALKSKDIQRMLDKIRVQKDSAEYKSHEMQEKALAEEQLYVWNLFELIKQCIQQELQPERYRFQPASLQTIDRMDDLVSSAALSQLADSCPPLSLPSLLTAFSISLNEERNIEMFQLLLQCISATNEEQVTEGVSIDASVHTVRTQLHVLRLLDQLTAPSPSVSSSAITQPLHSTLQEQLLVSGPLREDLRRGLHTQLLVLRCLQCSLGDHADSVSPARLAGQFSSARTRTAAVSTLLSRVSSLPKSVSVDVCTTIAAMMTVATASDAAAADSTAWMSFLQELITRRHWSLVLALYTQPPTSSLLQAQLTDAQQNAIYRQMLASCPNKSTAIKIGFSSTVDSHLPQLAMHHLVAFCSAASNVDQLRLDDALLGQVLSHGFLLHSLDHPHLLQPLMRFLVTRFQQSTSAQRRDDIGIGSLAHSLALLIEHQHYTHALALYYECHQTHSYLTGDDAAGLRLVKSCMQQAKAACQQQHVDATSESVARSLGVALQTYRDALATLVMHDFASQ